MVRSELKVRAVVVAFHDAAAQFARVGDERAVEDCRRRALIKIADIEAGVRPQERERLRTLLDQARDEVTASRPA
jgi:hypothetical protein